MMKFELPKLDGFNATDDARRICERFTRITRYASRDSDDGHNAWLVIDQQSFCITPHGADSAEEASWSCWQLALALLRLIEQEAQEAAR